MIGFDHLAVSGETLAEAREHVENALGVRMQAGGEHDVFFTHNALLGLEDGLYLEAIAINPDAPRPDRSRWFDLDRFKGSPRLTNWICRTDDLAEELANCAVSLGEPVDLQRGDLRWRMAVPRSGVLPFDNCAPALIQWQTKVHPATVLSPSSASLRRMTVTHPKAGELADVLSQSLHDERIVFEVGEIGYLAEFDTVHGSRVLTG